MCWMRKLESLRGPSGTARGPQRGGRALDGASPTLAPLLARFSGVSGLDAGGLWLDLSVWPVLLSQGPQR